MRVSTFLTYKPADVRTWALDTLRRDGIDEEAATTVADDLLDQQVDGLTMLELTRDQLRRLGYAMGIVQKLADETDQIKYIRGVSGTQTSKWDQDVMCDMSGMRGPQPPQIVDARDVLDFLRIPADTTGLTVIELNRRFNFSERGMSELASMSLGESKSRVFIQYALLFLSVFRNYECQGSMIRKSEFRRLFRTDSKPNPDGAPPQPLPQGPPPPTRTTPSYPYPPPQNSCCAIL